MKDYIKTYAENYRQEKAERAELDAKRDYHRRLADKYTRLAEEHQKKANKVPYYCKTNASWLDVLNDLCDDVSAIVGYPHSKADHTFGLRCETYVFFVDGDPNEDRHDNTIYSLCVTPDSTKPEDFALSYDTGEHKTSCPKGSIGDLNGFNNVTAPLPLDAEKVAEILKDIAARDLKQWHDKYNQFRADGWDEQRFKSLYRRLDDLALHLMLESEVFYTRNDETMGRALAYLQEAYPKATIDDLNRVYDRYSEIVTRIYG